MPEKFHSSEEICEALVRYVEMTGSELFEKFFVQEGSTKCIVFCMIGNNAAKFQDMVRKWLEQEGYKNDSIRTK